MSKLELLKSKTKRLHELAVELERVKRAESCTHHLVLDETGINSQYYGFNRYGTWCFDPRIKMMYLLVEIKTGTVVACGFKRRIAQFIRSRRIDQNEILDFELFSRSSFDYFQSKMFESNNQKIMDKFRSETQK